MGDHLDQITNEETNRGAAVLWCLGRFDNERPGKIAPAVSGAE
jgi:hypothetical protein